LSRIRRTPCCVEGFKLTLTCPANHFSAYSLNSTDFGDSGGFKLSFPVVSASSIFRAAVFAASFDPTLTDFRFPLWSMRIHHWPFFHSRTLTPIYFPFFPLRRFPFGAFSAR
jgi:hypothetical protein